MELRSLLFVDPPDISDEAASDMLDFLHELATAFENHYAVQLRRYYHEGDQSQQDLFEDVNDELPPPNLRTF